MFRLARNPDKNAIAKLDSFRLRLEEIDRRVGDRFSLRQAMALIEIAKADREGSPFTVADLRVDIPWRSVRRLRDMGLIDKEDDPGDRRRQLLSLTDDGRAWAVAWAGRLG